MRARIRELNVEIIVYHLHFMTNVDKFHLNKNVGQNALSLWWCKLYSFMSMFVFICHLCTSECPRSSESHCSAEIPRDLRRR